MRFKVFALLWLCVWGCGDEVLSPQVLEIVSPAEVVVSAPPESVWDGIRLNQREEAFVARQRAFYTKYIDADGIAILSHAEMEDRHLLEARQVVLTMTAKHPTLRDRLRVQHGFYLILYLPIISSGVPRDVPEYLTEHGYKPRNTCLMTRGRWWLEDEGNKGFCSAMVTPTHYGPLNTFTHEFAHALDFEIERLTPGFFDRLRQAYAVAKASEASDVYINLWNPYIIRGGWREYWAEGVALWYYGIGTGREFETYEAFAAVDPLLYDLLNEWFYKGSFSRDLPIPSSTFSEAVWKRVNSDQ